MKHLLIVLLILSSSLFFAGNTDRDKISKKTVAGRITNQAGESVVGTSITVIETGEVYYANLDGQFNLQLNADKPYTLRVSSIGYQPLEVKSTSLTPFSDLTLKSLY